MKEAQGTVEKYLRVQPLARERKNKNRAIANLLLEEFPAFARIFPDKEQLRRYLTDAISRAATLDRAWRKILEDVPELRGSDYGEKEVLEQEVQLGLGYVPNHAKNVKTLEKIAKEPAPKPAPKKMSEEEEQLAWFDGLEQK